MSRAWLAGERFAKRCSGNQSGMNDRRNLPLNINTLTTTPNSLSFIARTMNSMSSQIITQQGHRDQIM